MSHVPHSALVESVGCRGLLRADWSEGEEPVCGPAVEVGLADGLPLAGQEVPHGDEVAEDQPEHDVLAVQTHQQVEEGQGHLAQLQKVQSRHLHLHKKPFIVHTFVWELILKTSVSTMLLSSKVSMKMNFRKTCRSDGSEIWLRNRLR